MFLPVVTLITVIIDQLVKREVMVVLRPGQSWAPIPALERWFSFTYVTNTGAAFGLFPSHGYVFMVVAAVVAVAIAIYYWHMPAGQVLIKLSLGLQLGGAMGNLVDRLLYGHVVDFIDFKFWPVFNLADTSIVVGVALLAYALLKDSEDERAAIVQGSKNAL